MGSLLNLAVERGVLRSKDANGLRNIYGLGNSVVHGNEPVRKNDAERAVAAVLDVFANL
jgi:hypothetical protein